MFTWITQQTDLDQHLAQWQPGSSVALDTEFMRINTFVPRLALVQACVDGRIVLLDAPALGVMTPFAAHLARADTLTVMHSASEDLEALAPLLPDGPALLFDTQIAASMAGLGFGLSYQKLVALLLGIDVPKAETRSDWLKRPLSAQQLEYAAQDVEHLMPIHAQLAAKLDELGRSTWLAEDCRRMIERICHRESDPQPQRSARFAAHWPIEQQALLRRILLWRENTVRTIDCPRTWLLDETHAADLALKPPQSADELMQRTRGQRALRSEQRNALLHELQRPLGVDEIAATQAVPSVPSNAQKRAVTTMKETVVAIANELNLPEGLLCARKHLETLVQDGVWPQTLEGWRKTLLHDRLMPLMPQ